MQKTFTIPFILAWACLFSFSAHSQQSRSKYNLLWKISGNGLNKPSYLFGTMHLKDKRVFDFSDSVLVKLEACPAFAMEILPDTIIRALFSQYHSSDTTDHLKKVLSKEEYDLLDKRLKEEAGISIDKVKSKEPWLINTMLDKSVVVPKKGDKSTFLDAYLYKLARQGDKKLIGLEKLEEQTTQLDDYSSLKQEVKTIRTKLNKSVESKYLEELIKLYWSGDVEKLYALILGSGMQESDRNKLLTVRNKIMADRLVNNIREQPTFTAVGAAHLPGEDGLIKLLQQKGFTLSPVKATFTGMAANYKEKDFHEKWFTFNSEENAYAIDMPSEPFPYEVGPGNAMKLYLLPDLASGMFYYCSAMTIPNKVEPAKQEEFFKKLIEGMVNNRNYRLLKESKITFDNYPGREIELFDEKEAMYYRSRIYLRKNNVYLLMAGGAKDQLYGKESVRFFNSFRFRDFVKPDWKEFTDPAGAFGIKTPVTLSKQTMERNMENMEGVKVIQTIFSGADQQKGIGYVSIYNDFTGGFVIVDDSTYLNEVSSLAAKKTNGKLQEIRDINLQGFPGKAFTISAPNLLFYGRAYLKGSRFYYLIATTSLTDEDTKAEAENFLNSFSFTDFISPVWQEFNENEGGFTVKVPGKVTISTDSSGTFPRNMISTTYTSSDVNSGLPYFVIRNQYSDYYEAKDESSYFNEIIEALNIGKDTVLSQKVIKVDGMPGREIVVQTKGNHTVKRAKLVLKGSDLYEVFMYIPEKNVNDPSVNAFFDSFHLTERPAHGNLFTMKSEKLLKDLMGQDRGIQKGAKKSISGFTFTQADLPTIYEAIEKSYPDDTAQYGNTRLLLLSILHQINDSSTPAFIKKVYTTFPEDKPLWQIAALRTLVNMNSVESLSLFTDLILARTPKPEYSQGLFYALSDSLAPSKVMFPRIMALATNDLYATSLLSLTNQLCDSSIIKAEDISTYRQQLVANGKERFAKHMQRRDKDEDYTNTYTMGLLAKLLGNFPDDMESTKLLQKMMASKSDDLVLEAGVALLKNNKAVNKKRVEAIAANKALRVQLYEKLAAIKRLDFFPAKYLTQAHMAESSLVSYLVNDDEGGVPDKIVLLQSRETEFNGKRGLVYLYKFMYEAAKGDKETWYVGISGLQPLDKKQVSTNQEYTYTKWNRMEEKTIEEHFNDLISNEL